MEVISIIVSDDETPVLSIETFGVMDEEHKSQAVEEAEEAYHIAALDLKFGRDRKPSEDQDDFCDEINDSLEDGYIHIYPHTVSIVWSSINNIQL